MGQDAAPNGVGGFFPIRVGSLNDCVVSGTWSVLTTLT